MRIQGGKLFLSILFPLLTGITAAFLSKDSMNIYATINKPLLSPPGWLFPIVWTILYILMGVAAYLIIRAEKNETRSYAVSIYVIQLIFNFFWSIIFFNLRQYYIAFIWLVMLWLLILYMLLLFYEIDKTAAFFIVPYLIWVTYAGYLNLMIVLIN